MAKVMLVEDDNNLREIYEARLQAEGYDIVSAKDGEEALVVAKAEKPELVISDVMMPKISGFEMLDIMRNTDGLKDVKVIMLTALGQSEDQIRADKLGADRYLVKSQVTLEDIVKVTHELLSDEAPAAETTEPAAPVATSTPAPEAAATPDPAPVPDIAVAAPPAEPAPAESSAETVPAAAANTAAQSEVDKDAATTAVEEAAVEAKIEDFVAGASSEPTAPAPVASPEIAAPSAEPAPEAEVPVATAAAVEPAAAATTTPTATPAPADPSTTASDDKVMAAAVNNLMADTEGSAAPPPASPTPDPVVQPVTVAPPADEQSTADPATVTEIDSVPASPAAPAAPVNGQGSSRVIQPIDAEPKKDINALLAAEAAKDPSLAETPQAVVGSGDKPAPSPDPKDISL